MNRAAPHRSSGFTLIEVLVALTILSIALSVLLQILATNLNRIGENRDEGIAVSLTQSLLDQLGVAIPIKLGDTFGDFGDGFSWQLRVAPYGMEEDRRTWPIGVVVVRVSTLWDADRRSLTLTSLRIVPKDPP